MFGIDWAFYLYWVLQSMAMIMCVPTLLCADECRKEGVPLFGLFFVILGIAFLIPYVGAALIVLILCIGMIVAFIEWIMGKLQKKAPKTN